ncbi:MAG: hypothetical protein HY421_01315 [Candidatus Kerfeldbacteria bacterium]|nr:hypothetical protein [Candidatus Kerfeldbacteria bacterium]
MRRLFFVVTFVPLLQSTMVYAATPFSIEDVGGGVGLGTADLKDSTVNIIRILLGLLVVVALFSMVVLAGANYAWSGSSDKVKNFARNMFVASIVGIVIVLIAWAIVIFVAGTTRNVTS